ncbi:MAG: hypothetical protein [Circoviridae sp.]|nr:MAG: hypothetical protein [Circoviridae sp.]
MSTSCFVRIINTVCSHLINIWYVCTTTCNADNSMIIHFCNLSQWPHLSFVQFSTIQSLLTIHSHSTITSSLSKNLLTTFAISPTFFLIACNHLPNIN